jgi:hypothetical protein
VVAWTGQVPTPIEIDDLGSDEPTDADPQVQLVGALSTPFYEAGGGDPQDRQISDLVRWDRSGQRPVERPDRPTTAVDVLGPGERVGRRSIRGAARDHVEDCQRPS